MQFRRPEVSDNCIGIDVKIQLTDGLGVNKGSTYPLVTQALSGGRVLYSSKTDIQVVEQVNPTLEVNFSLSNVQRIGRYVFIMF